MGDCIYCGKPAGFLRRSHRECREKHDLGWEAMVRLARDAVLGTEELEGIEDRLARMAEEHFIKGERVREALIAGWEEAVQHFLDDGDLAPGEEELLAAYVEYFGFSQEDLDKGGAYTKFVQGAVLREVMEGKIPSRFNVTGTLPFNFQKSEELVWAFSDVAYYEERTRRHYVGGSQGVSIRIAKGVYYRIGGYRGRPVEKEETVLVDKGILALTTKHLYFGGERKSFRVPYRKIVSFVPYSDGIGIHRDAASAKPQIFVTGDGWFTYNLVVNLAAEG